MNENKQSNTPDNPVKALEELVPRCETLDMHDFPEIGEDERCLTCQIWELIDEALISRFTVEQIINAVKELEK